MDPRIAALEASYRHVAATRMAGVALLNPALSVEAVGFRAWESWLAGVLVTPWFMNLVLLPRGAEPLPPAGEAPVLALPGGNLGFIVTSVDGAEPHLSCSLCSPMDGFDTMDTARAVAADVLQRLLGPVGPADPGRRGFLRGALRTESRA